MLPKFRYLALMLNACRYKYVSEIRALEGGKGQRQVDPWLSLAKQSSQIDEGFRLTDRLLDKVTCLLFATLNTHQLVVKKSWYDSIRKKI